MGSGANDSIYWVGSASRQALCGARSLHLPSNFLRWGSLSLFCRWDQTWETPKSTSSSMCRLLPPMCWKVTGECIHLQQAYWLITPKAASKRQLGCGLAVHVELILVLTTGGGLSLSELTCVHYIKWSVMSSLPLEALSWEIQRLDDDLWAYVSSSIDANQSKGALTGAGGSGRSSGVGLLPSERC